MVTRIIEHPRKPGRYVVEIDGRDAGTVAAETLAALGVRVGGAADERLTASIAAAAAETATYDRAVRHLEARMRSKAELRRLLVRKGEPPELVDRAIDRLERQGYIDDASFARQFARAKTLGTGMAGRRVRQELARRGVARDVASEALEQVADEEGVSDAESIERVARKKWRTLTRLDAPTRRRRLYAFLARRGFDSDDVSRIVRQLAGEDADEETPESA